MPLIWFPRKRNPRTGEALFFDELSSPQNASLSRLACEPSVAGTTDPGTEARRATTGLYLRPRSFCASVFQVPPLGAALVAFVVAEGKAPAAKFSTRIAMRVPQRGVTIRGKEEDVHASDGKRACRAAKMDNSECGDLQAETGKAHRAQGAAVPPVLCLAPIPVTVRLPCLMPASAAPPVLRKRTGVTRVRPWLTKVYTQLASSPYLPGARSYRLQELELWRAVRSTMCRCYSARRPCNCLSIVVDLAHDDAFPLKTEDAARHRVRVVLRRRPPNAALCGAVKKEAAMELSRLLAQHPEQRTRYTTALPSLDRFARRPSSPCYAATSALSVELEKRLFAENTAIYRGHHSHASSASEEIHQNEVHTELCDAVCNAIHGAALSVGLHQSALLFWWHHWHTEAERLDRATDGSCVDALVIPLDDPLKRLEVLVDGLLSPQRLLTASSMAHTLPGKRKGASVGGHRSLLGIAPPPIPCQSSEIGRVHLSIPVLCGDMEGAPLDAQAALQIALADCGKTIVSYEHQPKLQGVMSLEAASNAESNMQEAQPATLSPSSTSHVPMSHGDELAKVAEPLNHTSQEEELPDDILIGEVACEETIVGGTQATPENTGDAVRRGQACRCKRPRSRSSLSASTSSDDDSHKGRRRSRHESPLPSVAVLKAPLRCGETKQRLLLLRWLHGQHTRPSAGGADIREGVRDTREEAAQAAAEEQCVARLRSLLPFVLDAPLFPCAEVVQKGNRMRGTARSLAALNASALGMLKPPAEKRSHQTMPLSLRPFHSLPPSCVTSLRGRQKLPRSLFPDPRALGNFCFQRARGVECTADNERFGDDETDNHNDSFMFIRLKNFAAARLSHTKEARVWAARVALARQRWNTLRAASKGSRANVASPSIRPEKDRSASLSATSGQQEDVPVTEADLSGGALPKWMSAASLASLPAYLYRRRAQTEHRRKSWRRKLRRLCRLLCHVNETNTCARRPPSTAAPSLKDGRLVARQLHDELVDARESFFIPTEDTCQDPREQRPFSDARVFFDACTHIASAWDALWREQTAGMKYSITTHSEGLHHEGNASLTERIVWTGLQREAMLVFASWYYDMVDANAAEDDGTTPPEQERGAAPFHCKGGHPSAARTWAAASTATMPPPPHTVLFTKPPGEALWDCDTADMYASPFAAATLPALGTSVRRMLWGHLLDSQGHTPPSSSHIQHELRVLARDTVTDPTHPLRRPCFTKEVLSLTERCDMAVRHLKRVRAHTEAEEAVARVTEMRARRRRRVETAHGPSHKQLSSPTPSPTPAPKESNERCARPRVGNAQWPRELCSILSSLANTTASREGVASACGTDTTAATSNSERAWDTYMAFQTTAEDNEETLVAEVKAASDGLGLC